MGIGNILQHDSSGDDETKPPYQITDRKPEKRTPTTDAKPLSPVAASDANPQTAPRLRQAAKAEEINERLVTFIEEGCAPRPHKMRQKPKSVWAFEAFLGGLCVYAVKKDRWNHAVSFAALGLSTEFLGHAIFDPDFPIRLRLDSHAASRQVAAGNALALGMGGEGLGAGIGFFGGASPGDSASLGAGASTAVRLSGKGK